MKLRICSDLHLEGDLSYKLPVMNGEEDQILLLAGDIVPVKLFLEYGDEISFLHDVNERFKSIIYIPGNHEYYGGDIQTAVSLMQEQIEKEKLYNIKFINNSVVDLEGVKLIASCLWTDMERDPVSMMNYWSLMGDYHAIKNGTKGLRPAHIQREFMISEFFIKEELSKDSIVITHHSPSYKGVARKFQGDVLNLFFHNKLDDLIYYREPKLWIHGHTHTPLDYTIGETRILCNPKGYSSQFKKDEYENDQFDPFLVVEV
jgi:predicted phosphodiesterase